MEADPRHQTQPSSAQQLCAAHPTGTPAASTAAVRGCAAGKSCAHRAVPSKHPVDVMIRISSLTEILRGACTSGSFLICCANCTWLFLSCEINSQRGKRLAQNANFRVAGAHVQHLPFVRQCPVHNSTANTHRCKRGHLTSTTPTSPQFSSQSRLPPAHEASHLLLARQKPTSPQAPGLEIPQPAPDHCRTALPQPGQRLCGRALPGMHRWRRGPSARPTPPCR